MCMKESLSETGPLWLSAVKRLHHGKDVCSITLTGSVSMTPGVAQKLNMARKLAIEPKKREKPLKYGTTW